MGKGLQVKGVNAGAIVDRELYDVAGWKVVKCELRDVI